MIAGTVIGDDKPKPKKNGGVKPVEVYRKDHGPIPPGAWVVGSREYTILKHTEAFRAAQRGMTSRDRFIEWLKEHDPNWERILKEYPDIGKNLKNDMPPLIFPEARPKKLTEKEKARLQRLDKFIAENPPSTYHEILLGRILKIIEKDKALGITMRTRARIMADLTRLELDKSINANEKQTRKTALQLELSDYVRNGGAIKEYEIRINAEKKAKKQKK